MMVRALMVIGLLATLSACTSMQAPTETGRGTYKIGKPYVIEGATYYPQEDYSYDETGIASWYGPGFHGRYTANGEVFDEDQLTAAHRTLPMPSLVRVTNLDNGKSAVVRVNDRGPFARGRIIDMSKRGSEILGFKSNGTAKVRVQILADESRAIADAAREKGTYRSAAGEGEQPRSAPVEKVAAQSLDEVPSAVDSSISTGEPVAVPSKAEVAGIEKAEMGGRFMPPAKATTVAVPATTNVYVQAGAFTKQANALRLAEQLSHIGKVEISEMDVGGTHFFRVRLPATSVDIADKILSQVIGSGQKSAKIIVDR
jgi:rare lipoprotein A